MEEGMNNNIFKIKIDYEDQCLIKGEVKGIKGLKDIFKIIKKKVE